ncbi:MAG TPA: DUF721 domain-containing protein [Candidatus Nitrosotalea sp.]|nr:DUF721 domain-containing protein [Candidatus Nitrosotalea sp.]
MLKLSNLLAEWKPAGESARCEPLALLEAGWPEIVGPEVAENSRPVRISGGALTILTRSNAWRHQLSFLSEHVLRAVAARMPGAGIEQLRFRVGRLAAGRSAAAPRRPRQRPHPGERRNAPASAAEALARFREDVEEAGRQRQAEGWIACRRCGALVEPEASELCGACAAATAEGVAAATSRLLFEAPWLGYSGTAALVNGLQEVEYERLRSRMLAHWWEALSRARASRRLSRDGRERLVASSYVVLRSKLPPEEIVPETVRNILGDELMEVLYGESAGEGDAVKNQKRRT